MAQNHVERDWPTFAANSAAVCQSCDAACRIASSIVLNILPPNRCDGAMGGAAISAGIVRYALERASGYARGRSVWGMPIGSHQSVAHPLAEAKIELELAHLMMSKASWLHDHDGDAAAAMPVPSIDFSGAFMAIV